MARTLVIPAPMPRDRSLPDPAGVTLNPGTGHTVSNDTRTVVDPEHTIIRITTGTTGGYVTVKASTGPGSFGRDIVSYAPAAATTWLGPFESASYKIQGEILLDLDSAITTDGTIAAFTLARR